MTSTDIQSGSSGIICHPQTLHNIEHKILWNSYKVQKCFRQSVHTRVSITITTPRHNRLMALFLGPPGWAGARRELVDFMVQGTINRGRHTDHLAGHHSIRTNQCPPPPSPYFSQAGCHSCRPTNSVKALKAVTCFYNRNGKQTINGKFIEAL